MSKNKLTIHLEDYSTRFVDFLKNFTKIDCSLLLEIDPFTKQFIAKTYTEDRSALRFSAVTLEDCKMIIKDHVQDKNVASVSNYRIKLGIFNQLVKLIKIIERLQDDKQYDIIINYDVLKNADGNVTDYVAENIQFMSAKLTMKMDGFNIKEFKYISDEKFNDVIYKIENPLEFVLTSNVISSIIKTSDIVKIDAKKDSLVFYVEGKDVYVKDMTTKDSQGHDLPSNFTQLVGVLDDAPDIPIRLTIFRERFIQLLDKTDEDFIVMLGNSIAGAVDRLAMHSTTTDTKLVISIINEE